MTSSYMFMTYDVVSIELPLREGCASYGLVDREPSVPSWCKGEQGKPLRMTVTRL